MSLESAKSSAPAVREPDAIYQNNRLVARVSAPQVDQNGKEIGFEEVYNSELLVLADECEFQKYKIIVRRIEYASKVNKEEPHKGRILRGVAAEILGYREQ